MAHNPYLVATNPNDNFGGGGDIAGPEKDPDSIGPWIVWPAQEFDSMASPIACVSYGAFLTMKRLFEEGEVLGGSEKADVNDADVQRFENRAGPESPEFDLDDPVERSAFIEALEGKSAVR